MTARRRLSLSSGDHFLALLGDGDVVLDLGYGLVSSEALTGQVLVARGMVVGRRVVVLVVLVMAVSASGLACLIAESS
jgi:hypothetical protein